MKMRIAPTALKGSLSALNAASTICEALLESNASSEIQVCPIADGGTDTLECLIEGTKGRTLTDTVMGPMSCQTVPAHWGVLGDGKQL